MFMKIMMNYKTEIKFLHVNLDHFDLSFHLANDYSKRTLPYHGCGYDCDYGHDHDHNPCVTLRLNINLETILNLCSC